MHWGGKASASNMFVKVAKRIGLISFFTIVFKFIQQ